MFNLNKNQVKHNMLNRYNFNFDPLPIPSQLWKTQEQECWHSGATAVEVKEKQAGWE